MNDYDGFVRAICENPEDDIVRLVLADWLQDNGEEDRGAFIRWCVRNRDVEGGITRQPHVHPTDRWGFDAAIPGMKPDWYLYRRGFVAEVRLPLADFLDHAKELFAAHPIERVVLTDRNPLQALQFFEVDGWLWFACETARPNTAHCLPDFLYRRLVSRNDPLMCGAKAFASEAECHAAMSAAAVAYGRQSAGLPPMPVPVPELTGN